LSETIFAACLERVRDGVLMLAMHEKGPLFALSPEFSQKISKIAGEVMEDSELMNDMSKKKPSRSKVFDSVARRSIEEWYTAKKGGISEEKLLQYASAVATLLEAYWRRDFGV